MQASARFQISAPLVGSRITVTGTSGSGSTHTIDPADDTALLPGSVVIYGNHASDDAIVAYDDGNGGVTATASAFLVNQGFSDVTTADNDLTSASCSVDYTTGVVTMVFTGGQTMTPKYTALQLTPTSAINDASGNGFFQSWQQGNSPTEIPNAVDLTNMSGNTVYVTFYGSEDNGISFTRVVASKTLGANSSDSMKLPGIAAYDVVTVQAVTAASPTKPLGKVEIDYRLNLNGAQNGATQI